MDSSKDKNSREDIEELKELKRWVALCPIEATMQLQDLRYQNNTEKKRKAKLHRFLNQRGVESSLDNHIIDITMNYIKELENQLDTTMVDGNKLAEIINNPREVGSYTKKALRMYQDSMPLGRVAELEEKLERERKIRKFLRKRNDRYKQAIIEAESWCDGKANAILKRALENEEE